MNPDKYPDVEAVNAFLEKSTGRLMDTNHQTYQDVRKEIERLGKLRERFNNYIDEMCECLAVGAMLTAQMTADMIMEEYGIVLVSENEEEYDEEAGEEE